MKFSPATQKEMHDLLGRYPDRTAALLPVLHLAQREFGWISPECVEHVALLLGIPSSKVDSTLSFYTMFNRRPVGKYNIQVCRTLTCSALGAKKILEYIQKTLKIGVGQTTRDGRFTITTVECLGACDLAPVMMINDELHERLTEARIDEIFASLP